MKENKKSFKAIPISIKKLAIIIFSLLCIIICFLFSLKFGLDKISNQKNEINKMEKNISVLKKKEQVLINIQALLSEDIKLFSLALPDSNPALSMIYQIKTNSLKKDLQIDNLKSGGESTFKGFSKVDLSLDLDGSLESIFSFLELTQSFSPIVTVERLELNQHASSYRASVTIRGYWSAFPKKIPAITQPLNDFTEQETTIITRISNLVVPDMLSIIPQEPSSRENPFE